MAHIPEHATDKLPWTDECYHSNESFPLIPKERGAAGQRRLALHYAATLATSPLSSARSVAEKLRGCCPDQRCGSGACPPCTWAAGRWFRAIAASSTSNASLTVFCTIQLPDDRAMPATLDEVSMLEQIGMLDLALDEAGLASAPIMGAADFSRNFWHPGGERRWSVHWALITINRNPKALTAALTAIMPDHPLVAVPVKTRPITRTPQVVFSYTFKNVFERKTLPRLPGAGRGPIIQPGDAEFETLAINLDRIGIMPRIYARGFAMATAVTNIRR